MFSIGEFSKLTQLTVKTLRFYHAEGLLVPAFVDPETGYRHYNLGQMDRARAITYLRSLEFSLGDIKELLGDQADEDLLNILQRQQATIRQRIRQLRKVSLSIDQYILEERQAKAMANMVNKVQEKTLGPVLVAGIRMKGRYQDCRQGFAKIGRSMGRWINGKALLLCYDSEYREDDADFEACMPVSQRKEAAGISVRELPGGKCVSLVHQGPYEQLGRSYAEILRYINEQKDTMILPTREIYVKCPGMIFRGNPKNYVTEIQILIQT